MPVKKKRYTGDLAKPIVARDATAFWGVVTKDRLDKYSSDRERDLRKIEREVHQQRLQKLPLLMRHFKIRNKADMRSLVLALASEHVPGFQIASRPAKRGRKKKWDADKLQELHDVVDSLKRRKAGRKDRQALKIIATSPEFASAWGPPDGRLANKWIETLESRLQEAKSFQRNDRSMAEIEDSLRQIIKKFRKL